jgi:hypothetical protein
MYKFTKLQDKTNPFDLTEVVVSVDAIIASDLTREFRYFLLACGFAPESIKSAFEQVASEFEEEEE